MIRSKRLFEFVNEFVVIRNEDQNEQATWECWLHKDSERSYTEFKEFVESNQPIDPISDYEKKEIVKESYNIINSFIPEE